MCRKILTILVSIVMLACQEKATLKIEKYPNGNIKSETYYLGDSIKQGIDKGYYLDGNVKAEVNYVQNQKNGAAKYFFPNGQLKADMHYVNDLLDGEVKWYHSNGQLEIHGYRVQGKEYGSTFFYYPDGQLEAYQCVDFDGNVIYILKVDESGQVIKEEGVVLSPRIRVLPGDSSHLVIDESITFETTVAQPPGYIANVWIREISNEEISNRVAQNIQNSTVVVSKSFQETGAKGLIVIGELRDKSGTLIAKDSIARVIDIRP